MRKNFKRNVCMILALTLILMMGFTGCEGNGIVGSETTAATTEPVIETTSPVSETGAAGETTDATEAPTEETVPATLETVISTEPTEIVTEPTEAATDPTQDAVEVTEPTEVTEVTRPTNGKTEETTPAHKHSYTSKVTAPTCDKEGFTTYTCSCGDSYVSNKVNATGHKFGEWYTTKEPTETATGTAERKCGNCGKTESKTLGKLTPSHKHGYTSKVTKTASCKSEGVKTFTCSCGDSYTEAISKLAHSYTAKISAPTCTADGYTTHTCSGCGDTYQDTIVEALGHSYKISETKEPTCTEDGYTKYTCERCGNSYSEAIKGEHEWVHTHTEEEGHWEDVELICRCGWSCLESKAIAEGYTTVDKYWYFVHVKSFELNEQRNHSYDLKGVDWVVDVPESDTWTCSKCGASTNTEP